MKVSSIKYQVLSIFFLSFVLYTLYCILYTPSVFAITPTPRVTTKPEPTKAIDKQINDLKERIASRVAQLKLVEKRGVIGTVTDVSGTQITLEDPQKETRFVDVDELTKFYSPSSKDFGLSDITKGTKVSVLGLHNKQSRRVMARFVNVVVVPTTIRGAVASVDSEEFTILVQDDEGKKHIVDVETVTKTNSVEKGKMVKSGFSKIQKGARIIVNGFPNTKDKTRLIASRIIVFPETPINPKIKLVQDALAPQEIIVPSTGSGTKLTPLR